MTNIKTDRRLWKTGTSTCLYGIFDDASAEKIAAAGINVIELSHGETYYRDTLKFLGDPAAVRKIADGAGLKIRSLHIPFSGYIDISRTDDAKIRRSLVSMVKEYLDAASAAGIEVAVIHPSSEPIADADRAERMKTSAASLDELSRYAKERSVKLAVENLPRTCLGRDSGDMETLLKACPELYVCFDMNHNLREGDGMGGNAGFIRRIAAAGGRIITLHVSDYDFIDERHWLPGHEGAVNDWDAIIEALEDTGYDGPWMYEVGSRDAVTPEELAENARGLLSR